MSKVKWVPPNGKKIYCIFERYNEDTGQWYRFWWEDKRGMIHYLRVPADEIAIP